MNLFFPKIRATALVIAVSFMVSACGGGGGGGSGEQPVNQNYTSIRMITKDKQEFTYGWFEIRMRRDTPDGNRMGLWPAFWLLGANINTVGWPACGEIDILEQKNNDNSSSGAYHFSNASNQWQHFSAGTGVTVNNFNTYALEWTNTNLIWYVNGVSFWSASITAGHLSEFRDKPFFIIINYAVGGPNTPFTGGGPNANTLFPANMFVDYVRVYQRDIDSNWQLAWQDEFDDMPDTVNDWTYEVGNGCPNLCGWGNQELQSYTAGDNASIVDQVTAGDASPTDSSYLQIQVRAE